MKPLSPSLRKQLASAVATFESALPATPGAAYLKSRGFDRQSAEKARLGYVAEPVNGFERFQGMLCIPNICTSGHVVGVKFRAITDDAPQKYDKPAGMPNRLFNLAALNDARSGLIVLTEGELDALSMGVLGLPAVGVQGVKSWKSHHERVFEDFRRVVFVRDADEAGGELAARLLRCDLPVSVVSPPWGCKDVNDALVRGRGGELLAAIAEVSS